MEESKSSKKNKKRRAAAKKGEAVFQVEEDVSVPAVSATSAPSLPESSSTDPIGDLKKQIEEAKAAKDHVKAQELRHKMWVLQDTIVLGKAGPGAPKVDLQDIIGTPAEPTRTSPQPRVASSTDPTEKKLSKLRKKLQQVETLKEKREKGEKLEANQVKVVDRHSPSGASVLICDDKDGVKELHQDGGKELHQDGGTELHQDGGKELHEDGGTELHQDGGKELHQDGGTELHQDGGKELHQDGGTELHQITKIEGEQELLEEISILEGLLTGATV